MHNLYRRRVNRFTNTDQCEPYIFPYCPELDFNLWRSPRTKQGYSYTFLFVSGVPRGGELRNARA
ncbi:hypothetical protein TELCIR_13610 [Teladorsagia circumcincta]|uniref:BPTI-like C-terminal domain-containing protein n=1 Tax=Teladorsagia circumcincta TaxID=45464 RepID=A0A2G9U3A7_TELCI|nr:hypothetical protein TELCIR_13610 [Teladorsagia circumcincta]